MQTQNISDEFPNVISITKIRKDIDALMDLLEKHPKVRVLRGQEVLFDVYRPETEEEKSRKIINAVTGIRQIRDSFKKTKENFSDVVIQERDKILSGKK